MGRVYYPATQLLTALLAVGSALLWALLCSALLCLLVVLCQVRVPRTGPGLCRKLAANAPGRKAVSPERAEMGSETCLLRASSVKGSAGEDGAPPTPALCCVSNQLEYCNPRRIHSLMGNHKC